MKIIFSVLIHLVGTLINVKTMRITLLNIDCNNLLNDNVSGISKNAIILSPLSEIVSSWGLRRGSLDTLLVINILSYLWSNLINQYIIVQPIYVPTAAYTRLTMLAHCRLGGVYKFHLRDSL